MNFSAAAASSQGIWPVISLLMHSVQHTVLKSLYTAAAAQHVFQFCASLLDYATLSDSKF